MNRFLKSCLLLSILACLLFVTSTQAQVAPIISKSGRGYEEVRQHLNKLYTDKENDTVRRQLIEEAEALANHHNEAMISLAVLAYGQLLGDKKNAERIQIAAIERYPRGLFAANKAYDNLFEENDDATTLEQKYNAFVEEYDISTYDEIFQPKFQEGQLLVINKYIEEKNYDKAIELIPNLQNGPFLVTGISLLYRSMEQEDKCKTILPLAQMAYVDTEKSLASNRVESMQGFYTRELRTISSLYADVLYHNGNYQQASELAAQILIDSDYNSSTTLTDVQTLARSYLKLGKKQEALSAYEAFIRLHGTEGSIAQDIMEPFLELYPQKDFDRYLSALEIKADTDLLAKYGDEMIKKEAPEFSLLDRDGQWVSLADYRGKIVILDFWATWCGPCIVSFPGMQAAVTKYADDPDVVFLFINTRQRDVNYKEVVDKFITKHNYTFHVLFDEMIDYKKSVVNAYGISGIPTKVVIDKAGYIRFQNAGGEENIEKLVKELDAKIALTKKAY